MEGGEKVEGRGREEGREGGRWVMEAGREVGDGGRKGGRWVMEGGREGGG